jgi:hypothetical protein
MTATAWALVGLTVLAGALCLWAWLSERQRPEPEPPRVAQHGRWVGEGTTQRLFVTNMPTQVIPGLVARGRCHCLHPVHVGRCRAPGCECKSTLPADPAG